MNIRDKLQEEFAEKYIKECNKGKRKWAFHVSQRFGKIKMTINMLNYITEYPKILISYPDNKIQNSWVEDFKKFNYTRGKITYTNTSSIEKYVDEKFDIYIFDECNDFSERQLESIEQIVNNTRYVIALSGTIGNDTEKVLSSIGLKILVTYSVEEAIKDSIISDYLINIRAIPLDTIKKEKNKAGKLVSEKQKFDNYTFIINKLKKEKKDFMFLALHRNRILQSSLSKQAEVKKLLKKLKDKRVLVFTGLTAIADNLGIASFHSKSKDKEVFNKFLSGEINHMALANMGKAGVTYPSLDEVILTSFTYNNETTGQILSRCMVLDYKEKTAKITIITSDEEVEIKKLDETLKDFNRDKIHYI